MSIHDYRPVSAQGPLATVMHCGRCGNVVADMVQHDHHHDLLDRVTVAIGQVLEQTPDGARKLTAAQLNERLRSPQNDADTEAEVDPEDVAAVALSCSCGRAAATVAATCSRGAWSIPWHFLGAGHNHHTRTARFHDRPVQVDVFPDSTRPHPIRPYPRRQTP